MNIFDQMRRRVNFAFIVLVLVSTLVPLTYLQNPHGTLLPTAQAHHSGVPTISAYGTPTVNAVMSPGEWASCYTKTVDPNGPAVEGSTTTTFSGLPILTLTFCEQNDQINDYYAFQVFGVQSNSADTMYLLFDNNHDGGVSSCASGTVEDALGFEPPGGPATFMDMSYCDVPAGILPTQVPVTVDAAHMSGSANGNGVVTYSNNGYTFEMSHPLNSGDHYDYGLSTGSTVGWCVYFWDAQIGRAYDFPTDCYYYYAGHNTPPATNAMLFGDIKKLGAVESTTITTPTLTCTNGTIDLNTGTTKPYTADPAGTLDPHWVLTSAPSGSSLSTPLHPFSVVPPYDSWVNPFPVGTANWVSPYSASPYTGPSGPYVYSISFAVSVSSTLQISGWAADNGITLSLAGSPPPSSLSGGSDPGPLAFKTLHTPITQTLAPGSYTLSATVVNEAGGPTSTGLLVIANVTCGCAQPPSGLIDWWPMNEGAGATSLSDIVGANNAVLFNPPVGGTQSPQPVAGIVGGAVYFPKLGNGLTGARVSPQGALVNIGSADFTIDAWVNFPPAAANKVHYLVNKFDTPSKKGYVLQVISPGIAGNERLEFKWGDGNNVAAVQTISPITTGQWHHVAVTFARNVGGYLLDIRLYVDGAQQGMQVGNPPGFGSLVNFLVLEIGQEPSTVDQPITIDELEIFDRALSLNEVNSIYSAGAAGKCPPTTGPGTTTITTWDTEKTVSTTISLYQSTSTQTVKTETTTTGAYIVETRSTNTWVSEVGSPATITTTITNSTASTSCLPGTTDCRTITFTNTTSITYTVTSYILTSSTSTILTYYTTIVTSTQSGGATVTQTITNSSTITTTYLSHLTTLTSIASTTTCTSCLPTTFVSSTTSPGGPAGPKCIIATAAYGSELAAPVQFLRNFRDAQVQRTFLGSQFLSAFNAWYYSWAPPVARQEAGNGAMRSAVRVAILPLLSTLFVAQQIFNGLAPVNPELAILIAGFVASVMLGIVYLTPITYLTQRLTKTRLTRRRLFYAGLLAASLALFATLSNGVSGLVPILTSIFVLESMILVPLGLTRKLTSTNASSK